jgi:hypothetical protein
MANLLVLHDTLHTDFARDLRDFFSEAGFEKVTLIMCEADHGLSVEEKENKNFAEHDCALLIITPGAVRMGTGEPQPSGSVCWEMAMAKQRYGKERTFYIVQAGCKLPAVESTAYTGFKFEDTRSITQALTHVLKNMKAANVLSPKAASMPSDEPAFEDHVYWFNDNAGKKVGPFCTRCWDDQGKKIRLRVLPNAYRKCPVCETGFDSQEGNSREASFVPPYDPF